MKYLLFDTETTNLLKPSAANVRDQPRIIEFFGMLCDEDGKEIDRFETLINPGIPITEEITRITGLTNEDVRDAGSFAEVADQIQGIISAASAVVAHNLSFDYAMVSIEFDRLSGRKCLWPLVRICTVENTEHLKGTRLKLMDLHAHLFGVGFEAAHRARNDVMAMHKCFFHMLKENMI